MSGNNKCDLASAPDPRVLTINTGSSSLRSALYEAEDPVSPHQLFSAEASAIGEDGARLHIKQGDGGPMTSLERDLPDHPAALKALFEWIDQHSAFSRIDAVGHRLVHGGPLNREPRLITPELIASLDDLISIDPDHLPQALQAIRFVEEWNPDLRQVACFDTSFHRAIPKVAAMYALPRECYDQGIMRYGFHGLSYEYIVGEVERTETGAHRRMVVAHLGNGASIAAIRNGKSIDTSMGFTPTAGLVMGSRCGDLDPGVLVHMLVERKMTAEQVSRIINSQSGLRGISETSEDMRELLKRASTDPRAREAIDVFCYRAKQYLGAYVAVLGGIDLIVFTGGIGENSHAIRQLICDGLEFLGIEIDPARNESNAPIISSDQSRVKIRVIKTDEDRVIASHTSSLIAGL